MRTLVVALLACVFGVGSAGAAEPGTGAAIEGRQLLVMLRLPAPHYRPDGSYATGYADAAGRASRRRVANELARGNGLVVVADWPMPILGVDCYVMDVPPPLQPTDAAVALERDARVSWAQPVNAFHALGHDDPLFAAQPAARAWHLGELHDVATGRGVRVAVIDSNVERDHPDLVAQQIERDVFVGSRADPAERHGTAVAGIIAAAADNHVGIAGVAPGARLLALRACREASAADTVCTTLAVALALHAAIDRGADVVNLSLSGPSDRLVAELVAAAVARGVGVVAAADRTQADGGFPASLRGVVAVVDDAAGAPPRGTLAAPGTDVPATLPGARWGFVTGASYAAAHVSGLLALMREVRGARTRATPVAADVVVTADGRVDACASLVRAGATCACDCASTVGMARSVAPR